MNAKDFLILYVDDERTNRVVFEQSLGSRFRIKTVASGAEALEIFRTEAVAVLITDQRMPDMSGHELLVRVKEAHPATVRIVITAYSDVDPILRAVNEGLVARYLIKPWDRAELIDLLTWALEAYDLGREGTALQLRLMQTERLVTLGSIAGAMLHDFTKPLGNVETNLARLTQLVKQDGKELRDELPEILRNLQSSWRVMHDLATGLHQFTRTDKPAAAVSVDPVPIVRYAMSVCSDIAVRGGCRIVYEGPAELPRVAMGSTELSQVLINLLANAAQALLARGKRGERVVVKAVAEETRLRFVITDTGVGMDPQTLRKVGTPFFSTRAEGTGLGVAQCKRLVGRVSGELDIQSVEGQGTTVTFTIPKV
jgi:signal transduction histidine kinase